MEHLETELEMILRHIAVGERHVATQHQRLMAMTLHGEATATAQDTLNNFEDLLATHRDHLARYRAQHGRQT